MTPVADEGLESLALYAVGEESDGLADNLVSTADSEGLVVYGVSPFLLWSREVLLLGREETLKGKLDLPCHDRSVSSRYGGYSRRKSSHQQRS